MPRGPQRSAAFGFTLAILGAAGFAWAYVADTHVRWMGLGLGIAFAGLAWGLRAWSELLPQGPFVEEREQMRPPAKEADALAEDLGRADGAIVSAPLPRRMLTLALGAVGVAMLFPLRSLLGRSPGPGKALSRTAWGRGVPVVREDGTPVRVDDLVVGSALTVYPKDHVTDGDAAVILVRVEQAKLDLPADRRDWAVQGVVAYSKICTHAGCPVGLFAQGTGQLLCPCHQSVFDIYTGAVPRLGPAARALPQLPLGVAADGTLEARADFTTPVGPGYWRKA